MHLIEWTEVSFLKDFSSIPVRIIARGSSFSFYVDDEWIAEVTDDTLGEGKFGFAGQSYEDCRYARFYLRHFMVESRPLEVEKAYFRWTEYVPIDRVHRINLAKTFFTQGQFEPAVVQLRKALKGRRGSVEEYMLLAESLVKLEAYEPALQAVDKALELDYHLEEALHEKANLLYLMGRLEEARTHIHEILPTFQDNASLQNLAGNTASGLSLWDEALEAYGNAAGIDPEMPLFKINLAKTHDVMGEKKKAVDLYLEAGRMLLRQEELDEIWTVLSRIKRIDPENREMGALAGQVFYFEEKKEEAEQIFRALLESGFLEDSAVPYLLGLILSERGERREALEYFRIAADLEPEVQIYRLRIAESLFLLEEDCEEDLKKALDMEPQEPWVNNLYGQFLMESRGELAKAREHFERAMESAQKEADIIINYTECLTRLGELDEAIRITQTHLSDGAEHVGLGAEQAGLINQLGNLFVLKKDFNRAMGAYERALELDEGNPVYMGNCASVYLELDMILKAEGILAHLLDQNPSPETYSLVAALALIQGEYRRAELALNKGLEDDPQNTDLRLNRAVLFMERGKPLEAKEIIEDVLSENPRDGKGKQLLERFRRDHEEGLGCDKCGRTWWVPKNLPSQDSVRIIGEPPGECPAGKCENCGKLYCVECAQNNLVDQRFVCFQCGGRLKISEDSLKYLVLKCIEVDGKEKTLGDQSPDGVKSPDPPQTQQAQSRTSPEPLG
jgi:tetratricopeptide (TPR) repeat protein